MTNGELRTTTGAPAAARGAGHERAGLRTMGTQHLGVGIEQRAWHQVTTRPSLLILTPGLQVSPSSGWRRSRLCSGPPA